MRNPKEVLGRGWSFPFLFDPARGSVGYSEFEENIRQNITIILGTKPGERQMLPDFGCRIHELMFAPDTPSTSALIARHVEDALRRWEERIEVLNVNAVSEPGGSIRVDVQYKILATDAIRSVSYTLSSR